MIVGEQPSFYIYPKHFSAVWLKLKVLCDVAGPGQIYSVSARFNPDWLKVAPIWAYAGSGDRCQNDKNGALAQRADADC